MDLINLIGYYNFKDSIHGNYLTDFNETYVHYRGGCVELMYQFSSVRFSDVEIFAP